MKEVMIGFSSEILTIGAEKFAHTNIQLVGSTRTDVAMLLLELELIRSKLIKFIEQQKPLMGVKKS